MSIRFLNKMSSYLFIFNPCISLRLICPCAHGCVLTFISFYFILFFVFACSKSLIVFISCHLILFLPVFSGFVPPGNVNGGSLVFWCFQGAGVEWDYWSYLGQSMMVSFGWWCSQFMPSRGITDHVVLGCFQGI